MMMGARSSCLQSGRLSDASLARTSWSEYSTPCCCAAINLHVAVKPLARHCIPARSSSSDVSCPRVHFHQDHNASPTTSTAPFHLSPPLHTFKVPPHWRPQGFQHWIYQAGIRRQRRRHPPWTGMEGEWIQNHRAYSGLWLDPRPPPSAVVCFQSTVSRYGRLMGIRTAFWKKQRDKPIPFPIPKSTPARRRSQWCKHSPGQDLAASWPSSRWYIDIWAAAYRTCILYSAKYTVFCSPTQYMMDIFLWLLACRAWNSRMLNPSASPDPLLWAHQGHHDTLVSHPCIVPTAPPSTSSGPIHAREQDLHPGPDVEQPPQYLGRRARGAGNLQVSCTVVPNDMRKKRGSWTWSR